MLPIYDWYHLTADYILLGKIDCLCIDARGGEKDGDV